MDRQSIVSRYVDTTSMKQPISGTPSPRPLNFLPSIFGQPFGSCNDRVREGEGIQRANESKIHFTRKHLQQLVRPFLKAFISSNSDPFSMQISLSQPLFSFFFYRQFMKIFPKVEMKPNALSRPLPTILAFVCEVNIGHTCQSHQYHSMDGGARITKDFLFPLSISI